MEILVVDGMYFIPIVPDALILEEEIRLEKFVRVDSHCEELVRNQADEFNCRLQQVVVRIWFDPKIFANYYPCNSIFRLWKQYLQYGLFKVLVMPKRRGISSIRQIFPAIFVLSIVMSIADALAIG